MMMIRDPSPVPNHKVMRGTKEIGGIGRIISNNGLQMARNVSFQPSNTPNGIPRDIAIAREIRILRILTHTWTIIGCLAMVDPHTFTKRTSVWYGVGNMVFPVLDTSCQTTMNKIRKNEGEI